MIAPPIETMRQVSLIATVGREASRTVIGIGAGVAARNASSIGSAHASHEIGGGGRTCRTHLVRISLFCAVSRKR